MLRMIAAARRVCLSLALAGMVALGAVPLAAQELESVDPDAAFETGNGDAIDGDLAPPAAQAAPAQDSSPAPVAEPAVETYADPGDAPTANTAPAEAAPATGADAIDPAKATYGEDDLIGAAEGVFGKGAQGLAKLIEDLLKKQGEPNAYIVGREAGGAIGVGLRYGSGTLHHKVEGERKVYWTGPSIGFDVGANAANTFVLVYNLWDSEDLYERFPAGEGQAYVVGGMNASYLRKGDVVLIPIRVGAGLRLGINAGYMKFSKEQRWLPF